MGGPPGPTRLLPVHPPRNLTSAGTGRIFVRRCRARRRFLPAPLAKTAEWIAVLSSTARTRGRSIPRAARAPAARFRLPRPRTQFHLGVSMHRRQALLTLFKELAPAAGFSGESAL